MMLIDSDLLQKPCGTVLFSGATDWDEVGRSKNNNLSRSPNTIWKPVKLKVGVGFQFHK